MVDSSVKLFESQEIRSAWNEDEEEWYFSIVDVVGALTESQDGRKYWNKLKQRLKDEGNETVTNCHQLKLKAADGKMRLTDVATTEQILRIVQSIPSKKAEPFKLWLAQVGSERIDEIIDPELTLDRALETYLKKGYDRNWVNQRLQTIQVRKGLTDEITRAWSGMTTRQYKDLKDLKKENLRDNMTTLELVLNTLAEVTTTEFSKASQPEGFEESRQVAREGGSVAGAARAQIEARTGKPVTTSEKARDFANLIEDVLETDYELTEGTGEPEGD